jgi:spoIIIJ-associated protein
VDKPPDAVLATTDILQSLVSLMDVSATITLVHAEREDVGGPVFDIDGDDSGLLIGRRGETLRAFQFLVSFIASRRLGDRVNLFVDVAGYQERRYETLRTLAQRVARRVASSGREVPLEPMPPNERRIVHMALADDPDVSTMSDGMGDGRRVVIEPID